MDQRVEFVDALTSPAMMFVARDGTILGCSVSFRREDLARLPPKIASLYTGSRAMWVERVSGSWRVLDDQRKDYWAGRRRSSAKSPNPQD